MRYFNKKSKNNRGILGIASILFLILGVVSLIFQSSTPVQVYGQVDVGPLWNMGEGDTADKSVSQEADTDGTNLYLSYQDEETGNVKLGKVVPNPTTGELGEAVEDDPQTIMNGATHPAMDVTPGGRVYVAAETQGEISVVGCTDDDDDCEPSQIVSTPGGTEPPVGIEGEGGTGSCTDKVDNDGDGKIDLADVDCKWSSELVSSERGLCSDRQDNDGDGPRDSRDPDCFHPSTTAGAEEDTAETAGAEEDTAETAGAEEDTAETAGAEEDTAETAGAEEDTADVEPTSFNLQPGTTSSPQLTFVSTDGGDAPPASDTDIASSENGEHVYVVYQREVLGQRDIMLVASNDSGRTWGAEINVSNTPGASINASVATSADGRIVDVAWVDTPGSGDIFYKRLTNFGATLGPQINLSNNNGASEDYQLLREGPNVYVVWRDKTTASVGGETYFIRSINDGVSFGDIINLSAGTGQTFQAARDPDMDAKGDKVVVTWAAYPDRNAVRPGEILVRESLHTGNPGTFDQRVNAAQTSTTDSREPQVAYIDESGSEIYLAFLDTGGPPREFTAAGKYNPLATERESGGRSFSALTNLADRANTAPTGNLSPGESNSLLELTLDVASWDPSGSRG
jgi:hypothetical protein